MAGSSCLHVLLCVALCCAQEQCPHSTGNNLMQHGLARSKVGLAVTEEPGRRQVDDARFLLHATFGPTRSSLEELSSLSYRDWIRQQMDLPVESHREYYRQNVNPRFSAGSQKTGSARMPCTHGSRWLEFALTSGDEGKPIEVRDFKVFVDGVFRTDVQLGSLASSWVGLPSFSGFVCYVKEQVGGDVQLSLKSDCRTKRTMPNPALWLSEGAINTTFAFDRLMPGVWALRKNSEACDLDALSLPGAGLLAIRAGGRFYQHDSRLELLSNTPNSLGDPSTCVPKSFLNEVSCRVPTSASMGRETVQGLKVEVYDVSSRTDYASRSPGAVQLVELVDPVINHSHTYDAFPGFPVRDDFAALWSGNLTIQTNGTYDFYLTSDDGSRLTVDGEVVVINDGSHGMQERTGSLVLGPGGHSIVIEYYEGGGRGGIVFRWNGPDSNGKEVVPASVLSTQPPSFRGCTQVCGSPGEVANDPTLGHQLAMWTSGDRADLDVAYDSKYADRAWSGLSKSTVWTMKALQAQDQLRQRMAWALSQIFVVSSQGIGDNHLSEMWLNYYDIFVRGAFGSFRDVLREVTYSPLMGMYLTHTGSSSSEYNRRFPNENYAREVMQLFTIGLDKLSDDGSAQRDADGKEVPAYGNQHILDFARALTGFVEQQARPNVEYRGRSNMIDPMRMVVERHDVYPKPDLDGNYLGDGFRLCADDLPPLAFLAKGARYEFRRAAQHFAHNATELSRGSALLAALCGPAGAGQCALAAVVELEEDLECYGAECSESSVRFVKVDGVIYEYTPPVCVHRFFREPSPDNSANATGGAQPGYCIDALSNNVGRGVVKLDSLDGNDDQRQEECLSKCRQAGGTGCELVWSRWNRGCYLHTYPLAGARDNSKYQCWVFPVASLGHSYVQLPDDSNGCPQGTAVSSVAECRHALQSIGSPPDDENYWAGNASHLPSGCSFSSRLHWNIRASGQPKGGYKPVCRAHIVVDSDGQLVQADGQTSFGVTWLNGVPAAGVHRVAVRTQAAFSKVPRRAELQERLHDGAFPARGACSACDGEVKVYGEGVNVDTVFELDGKYFKNSESVVHVIGGEQSFRNPPVFMRSVREEGAERGATAEVESLLDHLFYHSNTPVFVSKRLIQRFTSSNPSPSYVRAVGEAFRSGRYDGVTYSGNYGDLAATLAAILLYPEARTQSPEAGETFHGALREPILKFIHVMRSMEYKDRDLGHVVLDELQEVIGQFPYQSPTVFNFYLADFELPMPEAEPEPEPESEPLASEPEPEPEPEHEGTPVAPELQILTPPYFIGYLNGMSSLIKSGVSEDCDGGESLGVYMRETQNGRWRNVCPQGHLAWKGQGTTSETLEELDMLLTGGRLTPVAKEVVRAAYDQAPAVEQVQAAQQAITMTAEFNTLGAPLPKQGSRTPAPRDEAASRQPYKATVMLFLAGGADTWNLLVPQECELYQEYRDVRTDLALDPNELIQIATTGQACAKFGVHGSLPFLKGLYDDGDAAFVSNVGALVEPTTKEQFKSGTKQRCFGLFSHSDQQNAAQTLKCQDFGTSARGAGGRIADALAGGSEKFHTASFSLAGSAIWPQGVTTQREIVDRRGNVGFHEYERWRPAIRNITAQLHGNAYSDAYARAFLESIETTQSLGSVLDGAELETNYRTSTYLESALEKVARLIQTREGRNAERDFFFISVGGWDMHNNMKQSLEDQFGRIDAALRGFVAEMKAQNVWDRVLLATGSEFARTLDSNGGGSDHAWAGNHFIVGGGLKGGRVFNRFPRSLKAGNDHDLGRGRLIPDHPWESMMVPIAEWMGLEPGQLTNAFPNVGFFNSTHLIAKTDLFKA